MAPEVEAVAVADDGLGQATDLVLRLQHERPRATSREQVAGGQPRGAGADDYWTARLRGAGHRATLTRRPRAVWRTPTRAAIPLVR